MGFRQPWEGPGAAGRAPVGLGRNPFCPLALLPGHHDVVFGEEGIDLWINCSRRKWMVVPSLGLYLLAARRQFPPTEQRPAAEFRLIC